MSNKNSLKVGNYITFTPKGVVVQIEKGNKKKVRKTAFCNFKNDIFIKLFNFLLFLR